MFYKYNRHKFKFTQAHHRSKITPKLPPINDLPLPTPKSAQNHPTKSRHLSRNNCHTKLRRGEFTTCHPTVTLSSFCTWLSLNSSWRLNTTLARWQTSSVCRLVFSIVNFDGWSSISSTWKRRIHLRRAEVEGRWRYVGIGKSWVEWDEGIAGELCEMKTERVEGGRVCKKI